MIARYKNTQYYCTPYGDVYRKIIGGFKPMAKGTDIGGYVTVAICINGKKHLKKAHRMVYEAWRGEIPGGLCVDHLDFNRRNNNISNLQLLSKSENSKRKKEPMAGMLNPKSFMSDKLIIKCFESQKLPRNSRSKFVGIRAKQINRIVKGESHLVDSKRLGLL